jgi:hypothetical protein
LLVIYSSFTIFLASQFIICCPRSLRWHNS